MRMRQKPIIYVLEHHHELLYLWRQLQFRQIEVFHLDAHCDMHGLLVDRKSSLSNAMPGLQRVDCGNFLSFAVMEGIIKAITWAHDKYGGRNNDTTHVKYTTDLTAKPYLIRNMLFPRAKYPLKYSKQLLGEIDSFEMDEHVHLDIDWDFFFLRDKPAKERKKSIDLFFKHDFKSVPPYIYITYSPDYVVPSRREFEEFVSRLKRKYKANAVKYSYPLPERKNVCLPVRCWKDFKCRFREYLVFPLKRKLNNLGIY